MDPGSTRLGSAQPHALQSQSQKQVSSTKLTLNTELSSSPSPTSTHGAGELPDIPLTVKQAYRLPTDREAKLHSISPDTDIPIGRDSSALQIIYKPARRIPPQISHESTTRSNQIGAVARLAIDGGLTTEELSRIGQTVDSKINPVPFSSDAQLIIQPSHVSRGPPAISSLTYCFSRPIHQPVPYCTTYQPIRLSNRFRSPTDRRYPPAATRGWRHPRRGSFPLQMTRVGGLVLQSPSGDEPDGHSPYQSLSACASPSGSKNVGTSFFASSTPQSTPSVTPPVSLTSAYSPFNGEIVRLGPGNTVTHASSTDTAYTATTLIRMHECPQPYIGLEATEERVDYHDPTTHLFDRGSASPEHPSRSHPRNDQQLYVQPTLRSPSPDGLFPLRFSYPSPSSQPGTTASCSPFSPSSSTQIARTMRHLRRIRHFFGDSLAYPGTVISASTGALTHCNGTTPVSSNSLVDLRSHESRSADTMRPASYTCKCASEHTEFTRSASPYTKKLVLNEGLVRFEFPPNETWTAWHSYHLKLLDDTLVMSRVHDERRSPSPETTSPDLLSHVHASITSNRLSWHRPDDICPDWRASLRAVQHKPTHQSYVLICLRSVSLTSAAESNCHVLIDKHTAVRLLGRSEFAPTAWDPVVSKLKRGGETRKSRSREKSTSSRSSSLGIAGPPGGLPMFRAASTAAASVGVALLERLDLSPVIKPSRDTSAPDSTTTAQSILQDNATDAVNGTVKKSTKFASEYPAHADSSSPFEPPDQPCKRSRQARGRLHQAWYRMRRAATASSEATARSLTHAAAATTRRFASTHGLFSHSNKSATIVEISIEPDALSSPCFPASCDLYEPSSPSVSPNTTTEAQTGVCLSSDSVVDIDSSPIVPCSEAPDRLGSASPGLQSTTPRTVVIPTSAFVPLPLPKAGPLPLHKCPRSTLSPFVPFIVEFCVTLVERFGLNCVGLYRLSGSKVAHDFISTELRKTLSEINIDSEKWNDIHAVCGVLKTFLRNLPDSLFPKVMYADFLAACKIAQREKRLLSIQRLLGIMECYPNHPEYRAHRATLRYLATHLARVSARETVNKMTAYNLALVFAPNLVQPCEDSPELLMTDSKYKIMLVEIVIKYHSWIFSPDLGIESGCSIPTDSVEDLVSAVAQVDVGEGLSGAPLLASCSVECDEPVPEPERLDGDIQLLVCELFRAAADLPPPPSDIDLETAEEPGPSSDRPSDVVVTVPRPRFTSIPSGTWSSASLRGLDAPPREDGRFRPDLIFTQESDVDAISEPGDSDHSGDGVPTILPVTRSRVLPTNLGMKLDNLRHLSQGCLDQYANEARQLSLKMAESRRQLEISVAQRMHAEQLLKEARTNDTEESSIAGCSKTIQPDTICAEAKTPPDDPSKL